jgi:hypothetical protein
LSSWKGCVDELWLLGILEDRKIGGERAREEWVFILCLTPLCQLMPNLNSCMFKSSPRRKQAFRLVVLSLSREVVDGFVGEVSRLQQGSSRSILLSLDVW